MARNLGFNSSSYDLQKQRNSRDSFAVPRISISQFNDPPKVPVAEEEHPERATWSKGIQSLLLCLSMSVGLGNIWRFPNVAYNNGGGAFLIPYLLLLFIIGRPLYYLELILGQFSSQGPIKVWSMVPAFKGIGYAQVISLAYVMIFYNYLMALSIFYIFASMQSCLPWTECSFPNGTFNENGTTPDGKPPTEYFWMKEVLQKSEDVEFLSISWKLVLCLLLTWIIVYVSVMQGTDSLGKKLEYIYSSGSVVQVLTYFSCICSQAKERTSDLHALNRAFYRWMAHHPVFGDKLSIGVIEIGMKVIDLTLHHQIVSFVAQAKERTSDLHALNRAFYRWMAHHPVFGDKMSYFTSIFPFFGLFVLLVIACLEEGAWEGIQYFFKPDLEKLKDITVWYKATEQSFFSLNIAYGGIIMVASYNKFHNNIYRDAILISVLDTVVNLLAGCVSFAVLGSLAKKYSKDIHEVVDHEGLGMAFIVYPEALAAISFAPQLWSVVFFFMLFVLGVGSSMSQMETLLTVIKDRFPKLRKRIWLLSLTACVLFFCLGLPLTTNYGQKILVLLNNYGVGVAVFFYAVLEVVGVSWVYGLRNFCDDVEFMLNKRPGIFWKFTWCFTAPVALMVIFVFGIVDAESKSDPSTSDWASSAGWVLAALALVQIPLWFIVEVYKSPHSGILKKFVHALKPADTWGPSNPVHKADWRAQKESKNSAKLPKNSIATIDSAYANEAYKEDVF